MLIHAPLWGTTLDEFPTEDGTREAAEKGVKTALARACSGWRRTASQAPPILVRRIKGFGRRRLAI
jgi:hypothetical protein